MASPDRSLLACPECSAANRAGETACFLCGHRLDTTWTETSAEAPPSSTAPAFAKPANPYEPPLSFTPPAPRFRISSLMLLIVLVAVCAGVWHEEPILGIILAVAVSPAVAYTFIVASRSAAQGRPMGVFVKVWSFVTSLAGVVVIALSALIAFGLTCFPVGLVTDSTEYQEKGLIVALVIGSIAAVAAGAFMTRFLLTRKRRKARKAAKP